VRRLAAIAALAIAALAAAGCGGPPVDDARGTASFDRLEVHSGLHVEVMRGARPAVTVHGRKDVIDRVRTDSSGGVLRISVHNRGIVLGPDPMDDVIVHVTAPQLADVRIDGSGDVDLGNVVTHSLHFVIDGAGDVTARGRTDALSAVIHGAGDANFSGLTARTARVEILGAASVAVDVSERLDVQIQGAGEVRYTGLPRVTKSIHGAGDVRRMSP
jgi:hypothetical protein